MNWFTLRLLLVPLGLLGIRLSYYFFYNKFLSPLKKYPGPLLWTLSKGPMTLSRVRGTWHKDILALHAKYGSIVRVSPNQLSYSSEVVWKDVWGHRQGHEEFSKNVIDRPLNGVSSILTATRERHARYRRMLSHAFSMQGLREQQRHIDHYANLLMIGLNKEGQDKPLDMTEWFNWVTFDLIGDLAFGESFGCLENARTHPWIASIFGSLHAFGQIDAISQMGLTFLLVFVVSKELLRLRVTNTEFALDKVKRRVQYGAERGDFFDQVLKSGIVDEEKAHLSREKGMTLKEMQSNAGAIVLAGSETTATLLSGTVFQVLNNPQIRDKVVQEVRTTFQSEDQINIDSVNQLDYMIAVLTETMRIYPAVPTFADRRVPEAGDTVGGEYLPGGTVITFAHYAAYRYSKNFRRPDEFIPERWLKEGMQGEFRDDRREVFNPFSHGSRNCIGKNLAYAEQRLILAKVLWRFDLSIPEDESYFANWVDRQKTFILWQKSPLMVNVKVRKDMVGN